MEIPVFHPYKTDLLQEFEFNPKLTDNVLTYLGIIGAKQNANLGEKVRKEIQLLHVNISIRISFFQDPLFIGVHVRRTDYKSHIKWLLKGFVVTARFFKEAMQEMKDR